nr:unnamed protein product [Spirometra erinaceieuropaei]
MIFAERPLHKKGQEIRIRLDSSFVDLKKAFDTVNRVGLQKIMQKFGSPERFNPMVRQLRDNMMALVRGICSDQWSDAGLPPVFSLMFTAMLMDAYRDYRPEIRSACRTDGHLLNHRRIHYQSRVSKTTAHKLLSVDDCPFNATSNGDMKRSMDLFAAGCENLGLVVSTEKTVAMHQPPPHADTLRPSGVVWRLICSNGFGCAGHSFVVGKKSGHLLYGRGDLKSKDKVRARPGHTLAPSPPPVFHPLS